jgi:hypothetical protein
MTKVPELQDLPELLDTGWGDESDWVDARTLNDFHDIQLNIRTNEYRYKFPGDSDNLWRPGKPPVGPSSQ